MFLTLCSHYTVPPWWKQSFHPCFECALHSKTDRFNCTHSYSARQCSDTCNSEQSSTLMNEASYCMYNIQHFFFLEAAQLRLRIFFSPSKEIRSRNSRIDPIRSRVSKPLDQPARFLTTKVKLLTVFWFSHKNDAMYHKCNIQETESWNFPIGIEGASIYIL